MKRNFILLGVKGARQMAIDGPRLSIGRTDDNDLVLDDGSVSRRHAAVEVYGDAAWIIDLKSRNGTRLNDLPVACSVLNNRDIVAIGNVRLRYIENDSQYRDSELGLAL